MIVKLKTRAWHRDSTGHLSSVRSIQCQSYEEVYYENRTEIIVHHNPEEPGTMFTLITEEYREQLLKDNPEGLPHQYWEVAFIENDNGQTINKVSPPQFHTG